MKGSASGAGIERVVGIILVVGLAAIMMGIAFGYMDISLGLQSMLSDVTGGATRGIQ